MTEQSKSSVNADLMKVALLICLLLGISSVELRAEDNGTAADSVKADQFLEAYCSRCHNDERLSGNWSLSMVDSDDVHKGIALAEWEGILRTVLRNEMPPASRKQPSESERTEFIRWLVGGLDGYAEANPNPGRATLRRLNRSEYSNSVRDLLGLDIDVRDQLPADDTGYGFDNIADVLSVSPTLMDRYISVAGKLSRIATGLASDQPSSISYVLPKDGSILNQGVPSYDVRSSHLLPLDSRGGGAFEFYAGHEGVYEISGYLNSNTNNEVDRLEENKVRLKVSLSAGPHTIGMAFRKELTLDESVQTLNNTTDRVPLPEAPPTELTLDFIVDGRRVGSTEVPSYFMSPRYAQKNFLRDVLQIDVSGPYEVSGISETPSIKKIFSCKPSFWPFTEERCARRIISELATQAYRRPTTNDDIEPLMRVYEFGAGQASDSKSFEYGIAAAIQAVLVSPSFLFLVEQDPEHLDPGEVRPLNDYEFAARMSLFLWSSLPDEALIKEAEKGQLRNPEILRAQLERMLKDPRSSAFESNFSGQWLYLRNLSYHRPDVVIFPEFDTPLRQAMLKESQLFFAHVLHENRSITDFIKSDYTFLNERLAIHYDLNTALEADGKTPVLGPMFRKVQLPESAKRGGLLGQGSILTVTSYGNHTSVVRRGKWILDNLLAAPPPPPPPEVPALVAKKAGKALTAREQLALHSEDPACASCHVKMDPLGLALEKYDAVGKLRFMDAGAPIDASAIMPDGTEFEGLSGLQNVLLERKEQFATAFTQRLMTYALGRGVEAYDQPKIRKVVSAAKSSDYQMQSIIFEILKSEPFNYRMIPNHEEITTAYSSQHP